MGKQIHDDIAKCGTVSKARQVLDGLPSQSVLLWNDLIARYAQEGHAQHIIISLRDSFGTSTSFRNCLAQKLSPFN